MGAPTKISKPLKWTSHRCPICQAPMVKTNSSKRLRCYWGCGSFYIGNSKPEEVN